VSDLLARLDDHPVFGFLCVSWETMFDAAYDSHAVTRNVSAPTDGGAAFYEVPSVYPATVVQARYGGSYEGAPWLAFPCRPARVHSLCAGWDGDDVTCSVFWHDVSDDPARWPIGRGDTPTQAYESLVVAVAQAAGVELPS
jgi:hypothetical protein